MKDKKVIFLWILYIIGLISLIITPLAIRINCNYENNIPNCDLIGLSTVGIFGGLTALVFLISLFMYFLKKFREEITTSYLELFRLSLITLIIIFFFLFLNH